MTIDLTKPVQTRDGREVRILCTDKISSQPVCGLITSRNGAEYAQSWMSDGRLAPATVNGPTDLINVPDKRVMFVNMYPERPRTENCRAHQSRGEADKHASHDREACVRVPYVKGQFDEEPE